MTERRRRSTERQVGANESVGLRAVLGKHGSRRAARLLTDERTSEYA